MKTTKPAIIGKQGLLITRVKNKDTEKIPPMKVKKIKLVYLVSGEI